MEKNEGRKPDKDSSLCPETSTRLKMLIKNCISGGEGADRADPRDAGLRLMADDPAAPLQPGGFGPRAPSWLPPPSSQGAYFSHFKY